MNGISDEYPEVRFTIRRELKLNVDDICRMMSAFHRICINGSGKRKIGGRSPRFSGLFSTADGADNFTVRIMWMASSCDIDAHLFPPQANKTSSISDRGATGERVVSMLLPERF